jgi:hypothetical protein
MLQMLAHADVGDRGLDTVVIRSREFLRRIAAAFGVEGVDGPHPAAEPNGDDMLGFPFQQRRCGGGRTRQSGKSRGAGGKREKLTAVHDVALSVF